MIPMKVTDEQRQLLEGMHPTLEVNEARIVLEHLIASNQGMKAVINAVELNMRATSKMIKELTLYYRKRLDKADCGLPLPAEK